MNFAENRSPFNETETSETKPHLILANFGKLRYKAKIERAHRSVPLKTHYVFHTIKEKHTGYSLTKMLVSTTPISDFGDTISSSSFSSNEILIPGALNYVDETDFSDNLADFSDETDSCMMFPCCSEALYYDNEDRPIRGGVLPLGESKDNASNRSSLIEPRDYRDSHVNWNMPRSTGNSVHMVVSDAEKLPRIRNSEGLSDDRLLLTNRSATEFRSVSETSASDVLSNISSIDLLDNVTSTSDVLSVVSSIDQVQGA